MLKADQQKLLAIINARIQELQTMLQEQEETVQNGSGQDDDEAARLDNLVSPQKTVMERERSELKQLQASLAWLSSDEGGYCMGCGEEIQIKRLLTVPTTRYCIACAEQLGR